MSSFSLRKYLTDKRLCILTYSIYLSSKSEILTRIMIKLPSTLFLGDNDWNIFIITSKPRTVTTTCLLFYSGIQFFRSIIIFSLE